MQIMSKATIAKAYKAARDEGATHERALQKAATAMATDDIQLIAEVIDGQPDGWLDEECEAASA